MSASSYCSPFRCSKSGGSCFTIEELRAIADAYNQSDLADDDDIINLNQPKQKLWQDISSRLSSLCDNEACWTTQDDIMRVIRKRDKRLYQSIKYMAFKAPAKKSQTEWLTSDDINYIMEQYEAFDPQFKFLGSLPSDFYNMNPFPFSDLVQYKKVGIVFNLDESDEPGSHWVAMYFQQPDATPAMSYFPSCVLESIPKVDDPKAGGRRRKSTRKRTKGGRGKGRVRSKKGGGPAVITYGPVGYPRLAGGSSNRIDLEIDFFDSTGNPPISNLSMVIEQVRKFPMFSGSFVKINQSEYQYDNNSCGVYSTYFIIRRVLGDRMEDIQPNDKEMTEYRKNLFRPSD